MTFRLRHSVDKRDLQSIRSKNGNAGEDVLQAYNDVCLWHKIAEIYRVATPMRILDASEELKHRIKSELGNSVYPAVHCDKQGPDYFGYMLDDTARHISIECKHTQDDSKPFRMSAVTEHQRARLDRSSKRKAISLLALVHGRMKKLSVFEWDKVKDLVSISPEKIQEEICIVGEPYLKKYYRKG